MLNFYGWWIVFALFLLILAAAVGRVATGKLTGILVDSRGRFSLTHLQTVAWTLLILSAFAGVLVASDFDVGKAKLSSDLLALMGIATGSAVLSTGVKAVKDAPGSSADVAKDGRAIPTAAQVGGANVIKAKFSQIWLEEEGDFADKIVSIAKFQNFVFTLAALAMFISLVIAAKGLPAAFPDNFLAILGISHAGYVAGKIPNKT